MSRFSLRIARRLAVGLILGLLGGLLVLGGPSGTSQPASALDFCPGFLKAEDAPGPARYRAGLESVAPTFGLNGAVVERASEAKSYFERPFGKRSATLQEHVASNGLTWSRYDDGCGSALLGGMQNIVANQLFSMNKGLATITIGVYTWATTPDLLDGFLKPINCVIKGCGGAKGLDDTLFLNFLQPVLVIGALWMGWVGLVKRSTTQAWQGAIWMIAATSFALVVMANPTGLAKTANNAVADVNAITSSTMSSAAAAPMKGGDECYLPDGAKNRGNRIASCSLWKALVYTPWAVGQFGNSQDAAAKVDASCQLGSRKFTSAQVVQLCAQSETHDEYATRRTNVGAKEDAWETLVDTYKDDTSWTGKDAGFRINIAFSSLLATIAAGLIVVIVAFQSIVQAFGMVMLLLVAPVFLLLGVHPGFGRGVMLKWLELLVGTVFKRIVLGLILALLIALYQIIVVTDTSWLGKIAMIGAVGVASVMFRQPMMEALNVVRFGGSQTGLEQGGGAGKAVATSAVGGMLAGASAMGGGARKGAVARAAMTGAMATKAGLGGPAMAAARMGVATGQRAAIEDAKKRPTPCAGCGIAFPAAALNDDNKCKECRKKKPGKAKNRPEAKPSGTGAPKGGGDARVAAPPRPDGAAEQPATDAVAVPAGAASAVVPATGQAAATGSKSAPRPEAPGSVQPSPAAVSSQADQAPRPGPSSRADRPDVPAGLPTAPPGQRPEDGLELARDMHQRLLDDPYPATPPPPLPSRRALDRSAKGKLPSRRPKQGGDRP